MSSVPVVKLEATWIFQLVSGSPSVIKACVEQFLDLICAAPAPDVDTTALSRIRAIAARYPNVLWTQCVPVLARLIRSRASLAPRPLFIDRSCFVFKASWPSPCPS